MIECNVFVMYLIIKIVILVFLYLIEEIYKVMDVVKKFCEKGYECYYMMDVGLNVKVFCLC